MAIYHASLSYFSRQTGKHNFEDHKAKSLPREGGFSSVAAAAYRAGCQLTDLKTGEVHDYRAKAGVFSSFMLGSKGLAGYDRQSLWNKVEEVEDRVNSRVAYEWDIALPRELSHEQRLALARQLGQDLVDRYGVVVDGSIHLPPKGGNPYNHHLHILMTTRALHDDGSWAKNKVRLLSSKKTGPQEIVWFRAQVELRANAALKAAGYDDRISHLSHKERGIGKKPGIHVGRNATNAMRRGQRLAGDPDQWAEVDGGQTRHQANLQAGAVSLFTARQRMQQAQQELDANNAALEARLEREKEAAARPRSDRLPRIPPAALRGRPADERFMLLIARIFGDLLNDMFMAITASMALAALAEQQAKEAREIRTLRRHSTQLRGDIKRWARVLEGDRAAAAKAAAPKPPAQERLYLAHKKNGYATPELEAILSTKRTRPQKRKRPQNGHIYSFTEKMLEDERKELRRRRRRKRKDWESGSSGPTNSV